MIGNIFLDEDLMFGIIYNRCFYFISIRDKDIKVIGCLCNR